MGLIDNEVDVKKQSQFLEYEVGDAGNELMLKSKLYQINTHFINSVKRSVMCKDAECLYCAANYNKRAEYHYLVYLNGQTGFIDIKASVFFNIQGIAKAQKKDPRAISWTVIKTGSGLDTEYTTSKMDNLSKEDYEEVQENLEANTAKLVEAMERREEDLQKNYTMYVDEIRDQKPAKKARETKAAQGSSVSNSETEQLDDPNEKSEVSPDDIPF
jgi:hypothetical protein